MGAHGERRRSSSNIKYGPTAIKIKGNWKNADTFQVFSERMKAKERGDERAAPPSESHPKKLQQLYTKVHDAMRKSGA